MKNSPLLIVLVVLLAVGAVVAGAWVVFDALSGPHEHGPLASIRVKVDQPEAGISLPSAVGDEKSELDAATAIPPLPPEQTPATPKAPEISVEQMPPLSPPPAAPPPPPEPAAAVTPPPSPEKMPVSGAKPKIAIVIDDLGLDIVGTRRAMALPGFVTLSFMPYAMRLREQTKEGRDGGHELLLHMPMEPMGHEDPGPGALLVALPPDEIRKRFENGLASFTGFDGVNNHMGSKFTADTAGMEIVIDELQQRHLFFLDSRTSGKTVGEAIARQHGLPTIGRDIFLDDDEAIAAVREEMEQTERVARRKGEAVAIGHPHAATLEALEKWLPDAQARGFEFVPLHDLIKPAQ